MEYNLGDLVDKSGCIFWVCDYRYRDARDKPIRAVTPVRAVLIVSENKWHHRPELEFFVLRKDGRPSTRKINFMDNTAWGSRSLNVFDTEEECKFRFQLQAKEALEFLNEYERRELARLEDHRKKIREALK